MFAQFLFLRIQLSSSWMLTVIIFLRRRSGHRRFLRLHAESKSSPEGKPPAYPAPFCAVLASGFFRNLTF
jgi:hypothetical protein